ncbi:alpha-hydroxy-acid oxidizing protein [Allopusillimonas ginsengisoli]|nr:alpha-hydroxy-acid oxidizing protein [Allopusillimonas ginsengisoli]
MDEKGVLHAMDLFATELRRNTAMLGLTRLTDVDAKYLYSVFAYC